MAEETIAPVPFDATNSTEATSGQPESTDVGVAADAMVTDDGDVAPAEGSVEPQAAETAGATDDQAAKDEPANEQVGAAPNLRASTHAQSAATTGTPAKKTNSHRRKSSSGVPEHKSKKTPNKKKKQPELHLDAKPGDMYMVAMRGYQPWPIVICDDEMLPDTLLAKRPVSAMRVDGTYREDFLEGGKNAKDRRYPIMFLHTNEFAWQANTDFLKFNLEDVKKEIEAGNMMKKNKSLGQAYEIAAEGHDLDYFKELLKNHEQALVHESERSAAKADVKAAKKEKAVKRKSSAAVDSEDIEMDDVDEAAPASKKKGTKRKKDDDSDGEQGKPAKTPKTKLKINNKPKDASAAKPKKESKAKKAKATEAVAEAAPAEPQMTEEERLQKREKSVLYLRHRLQKGFLSRDQAPQDEDMPNMADHLKQLEEFTELEAEIIKNTKVHKVLKAILKLNTIPREDEFHFKPRSNTLLTKWTGTLSADGEPSADAPAVAAPATNGVKHEEEKKTDTATPAKSEEPAATVEAAKSVDGDGDVSMAEAKADTPDVPVEVAA